jgi:hypothetical protein
MTITTIPVAASLLVAGMTLAAQEGTATVSTAETGSAAASAPIEPERSTASFSVAGGYLYQFSTDFDDGPGSVSVNRAYGTFSSRFEIAPSLNLGLRFGWEGGWYDFDGNTPLSLGTGASPWNTVQGVQLGANLGWKINEEWSTFVGIFGAAAGETDADASDTLSIGGSVGAMWRANDDFSIGGGVLVSSQIEDDALVIPLLLIDWRINDALKLTNIAGPEAYPTGAGIELVCTAVPQWEFGIGGRYESRRFRLDDRGPAPEGVGEDSSFATWLRVGVRPLNGLRIDVLGGLMVWEEYELDDRNGNDLASSDLDPSPFVGVFLGYRF